MSAGFRATLNGWRRRLVRALLFRTVFGERSQGRLRPGTRVSPSTHLESPENLSLADHVYIGPFTFIEASGGVTIGEGVQIASHVCIITHSSHRSQRLLGAAYSRWPHPRPAWIGGPVTIGDYCFIGPHSLIEANTHLGAGSMVCAGAVVRGRFPPFSVLAGSPAQVVGDTRQTDEALLARYPEAAEHYRAWVARVAQADEAGA